MSKYIIDIPKTVGMLEKVGCVRYTYFDGIQVQTIVLKSDEIEELNSDYINEHFGQIRDEAYKRGFEDGYRKAMKDYEQKGERNERLHHRNANILGSGCFLFFSGEVKR